MLLVRRPGETGAVVIDHSRFIGLLWPVDEESPTSDLKKAKSQFPKATHYCYALRGFAGQEKAEDDGEPPGTAGIPLLDLLRSKNVGRAILIVVRYFGGTKLGKSRLYRTYREVGLSVLNAAELAESQPLVHVALTLSFDQYFKFQQWTSSVPTRQESVSYGSEVCWQGWMGETEWKRMQEGSMVSLSSARMLERCWGLL